MLLNTREWGPGRAEPVVCVHGTGQHGGVFEDLAGALRGAARRAVAVDLRGHGASGHEPPWDTDTHAGDVLDTVDALGIEQADYVAHSYGGLVAAAIAARSPERVRRLVLLDPAIELDPPLALTAAETDRTDWSFASADAAVNALMSSSRIVAAPRETVAAFVASDLRRGRDARLRFGFCASAAVVMWSEMTRPAPAVAQIPTLIVRPVASFVDGRAQDRRYRQELGSLLTIKAVPNGHNVLWESPGETGAAVLGFLEDAAAAARPAA